MQKEIAVIESELNILINHFLEDVYVFVSDDCMDHYECSFCHAEGGSKPSGRFIVADDDFSKFTHESDCSYLVASSMATSRQQKNN